MMNPYQASFGLIEAEFHIFPDVTPTPAAWNNSTRMACQSFVKYKPF